MLVERVTSQVITTEEVQVTEHPASPEAPAHDVTWCKTKGRTDRKSCDRSIMLREIIVFFFLFFFVSVKKKKRQKRNAHAEPAALPHSTT